MSAFQRIRTDEPVDQGQATARPAMPPPGPIPSTRVRIERVQREHAAVPWPPKDRVVALGELLTTKRMTGQDAPTFPAPPRVPHFSTPTPWFPERSFVTSMRELFADGRAVAIAGIATFVGATLFAVGIAYGKRAT